MFVVGDAVSTRYWKPTGKLNETECINSCIELRKKEGAVNAVTMWSADYKRSRILSSECRCHASATSTNVDGNYKTCFLENT